jgi:hypothetical protein
MPKKSKVNAAKGKTPAAPELTQATIPPPSAPVEPPTSTSAANVPPTMPPPNFSEDFWTKNARAKALIMSTLVPGSEAWKIAEPLELASEIMAALEEKYAPKDVNGKPLRGKELAAWDREYGRGKENRRQASLDSRGVSDDTSALTASEDAGRDQPASKDRHERQHGLAQVNGLDEPREGAKLSGQKSAIDVSSSPRDRSGSLRSADHDLPIPETFDLAGQDEAKAHDHAPALSTLATTTKAALPPPQARSYFTHDSYLSEHQASIFLNHDIERKAEVQDALAKALMQKLPNRDARLLWAIMYGGEEAPWPGSSLAVIPGVSEQGSMARAIHREVERTEMG